ncbi:MAG: hypothetical protein AB7F35_31595, partial [Acetobacteraceae bacterium]
PGIQTPQGGMTLHTADGARKYLTAGEREAFLRAAEQMDRQARTFCMTHGSSLSRFGASDKPGAVQSRLRAD